MRIASLVPSATEMLFALGLGDSVVAVTHECDHPARTAELPRLTASVIEESDGDPGAIDARVRELVGRGEPLYRLDEPLLAELRPDLIVTQALCAVCAVSVDDVRAVAGRLANPPAVLSLDPERLAEVLADAVALAEAAGEPSRGEALAGSLRERVAAVEAAVEEARRPRVAMLEWLDPVFAGGHWAPEMIELAGGSDVLGIAGEKSRTVTWEEVRRAEPQIVLVAPCGLDAPSAAAAARDRLDAIVALGPERVIAVDAAASFSRPGPRLVDGIELLGHLFHPRRVPQAGELAFETVWESTAPSSRSR